MHEYVEFHQRSTINSVENLSCFYIVLLIFFFFSVFAPPGGRSTNIFGVPEPEAPMTAKKNHMESDIFGCKKDNVDSAPAK